MYFDTAYIAKYYLNEPESPAICRLVGPGHVFYSSILALTEVQCVFHRHVREGILTAKEARELAKIFLGHVEEKVWELIPAGESFLRRAGALVVAAPAGIFLRTADAIHLTAAMEAGEHEVWTNDRHMLAAAPHFGLIGRSV